MLGLPSRHDSSDREHLWFRLDEIRDATCQATLMSHPEGVPDLHPMKQGQFELSLITDWKILCPWGEFDPDTVDDLMKSEEDARH